MTSTTARYAIHWVPVHDDPLAEFGRRWSSWCADMGERHAQIVAPGLDLAGITAESALNGFHGVICRPFRANTPRWSIESALTTLADGLQEIDIPGLTLGIAGRRIALIPAGSRGQLASMVARVHNAMAPFRAGPRKILAEDAAASEMAKCAGLEWTDAESFHLPLTDALSTRRACELVPRIRPLVATALVRPFRINDIALVTDPGAERPLRVEDRYTLSDRSAAVTDTFECRGPRTLVTATVPLAFAEAG